ncbi:MAG TPA: 30S ribosomal protein S20 [Candidatus Saccharibacteria bacterium]|jgi:small subunit ribosomal protein S20|nr:30S ribosomal protein S20 [Candidatus Saccharibacteria bacterium]
MPLTKSVIKRMKQSNIARLRNFSTKKSYKVAEKNIITAMNEDKSKKDLNKLLDTYFSSLDTAVKKNVIHKNKAARKKSQLAQKVKSV